jgi:hypothetical protein
LSEQENAFTVTAAEFNVVNPTTVNQYQVKDEVLYLVMPYEGFGGNSCVPAGNTAGMAITNLKYEYFCFPCGAERVIITGSLSRYIVLVPV